MLIAKTDNQRNDGNKDSNYTGIEQKVGAAVSEISKALLGKEQQIRLALCCLFSVASINRRSARHGQNNTFPRPGQGIRPRVQPHSIYQ